MQIVINIPDKDYERIMASNSVEYYELKIAQGTPLPRGHGRLIDEKEITKYEQVGLIMKDDKVIRCFATDAPTVIPAEK